MIYGYFELSVIQSALPYHTVDSGQDIPTVMKFVGSIKMIPKHIPKEEGFKKPFILA